MSVKKFLYLFILMLLQTTGAYAAIGIQSPAANSVRDKTHLAVDVNGTCTVGQILKINATDSVAKATPLVWTQCQSWGFAVTIDISSLKDGAVKVSVLQDTTKNPQSASVSIVKSTAAPTPTPTPTPVATPKPTPVATPTPSPTPVATPQPTPVATPTPTPVATPTVIKVMPLGDSLTLGYGSTDNGGYRVMLESQLNGIGASYDFVGSQNDGPLNLGDKDHEGHYGWRTDQILANVDAWMTASKPDTVLLLIGGNDILQNYLVSSAPSRVMQIVDKIRAKNPKVIVMVANIYSIPGLESQILSFDRSLNSLVNARTAAGQKVYLVDMYTNNNIGQFTVDGVHPDDAGYDVLGRRWFDALINAYNR